MTPFKFLMIASLALTSTLALADGPGQRHPLEDPSASVFESAACVGPTLSSQDAAAKFCRGANQVELTRYTYALRVRQCNTLTDCSDWKAIAPDGHVVVDYQNNSLYSDSLVNGGKIILTTTPSAVNVTFLSDRFAHNIGGNIWTTTQLPNQTNPSVQLVDASTAQRIGLEPTRSGIGFNADHTTQQFAYITKQVMQFTDHCGRFVISAKPSTPDSTGSWMEYQFGAMARY